MLGNPQALPFSPPLSIITPVSLTPRASDSSDVAGQGPLDVADEKLKYFENYGFTIHSAQGEDHESYIYIDINRLKNNKILYTAISV